MLWLCTDTTGDSVSFTLADKGRSAPILSSYKNNACGKSSEVFFPALNSFLTGARIKPEEVDVWVAIIGPGSFTGIRVALAAFLGISVALNKELLGIASLDACALLLRAKTGREVLSVACKLRAEEFALRDYNFKTGRYSNIYIRTVIDRTCCFLVHSQDIILSEIIALDCTFFLQNAAPIYAVRSQAEINLDKKSNF